MDFFKASLLMEKRSSNQRLVLVMSVIFCIFALLWSKSAGRPDGSYSVYTVLFFNMDTFLFVPLTVALLVNGTAKRTQQMADFFKGNPFDTGRLFLSRIGVLILELVAILLVETIFACGYIYFVEGSFQQGLVTLPQIFSAFLVMTLCSLPLIPLTYGIRKATNQIITLFVSLAASIVATVSLTLSDWWLAFPWTFGMRAMAALLGIHPNSTMLQEGTLDYQILHDPSNIGWGLLASALWFAGGMMVLWLIERGDRRWALR